MIVAKATGDRRTPRKIFGHEWTHHVTLEALFMIDDVIGNTDVLGHSAGVVDIVERATAAGYLLGHALVFGQAALVQSCMVSPMTSCPSACSIAATVKKIDSA